MKTCRNARGLFKGGKGMNKDSIFSYLIIIICTIAVSAHFKKQTVFVTCESDKKIEIVEEK